MTQEAIVIRTLPNQMAEVLVKRPTACGANCGSCESCIYQSELKAVARNTIAARPGQKVTIATKSSKVFSAALLVYILPLVFFVLGFAVSRALGASEGLSILVSFLCLIPAAFLLIRSQKHKPDEKQITLDIIAAE